MARLKDGILGGFSGKAGSVIGYISRGKSYIRGVSKKDPKKPTPAQVANRERFRVLNGWRGCLGPFFGTTFSNHRHERSAQNAAHAFNSQIIVGEYPNFKIDYKKVIISKGSLPNLADLAMQVDQHRLHFTWKILSEPGIKDGDVVAILVLFDTKNNFYQGSTTAAYRTHGKLTYELGENIKKFDAHIYITVLSDDRERAADSIYMGKIKAG